MPRPISAMPTRNTIWRGCICGRRHASRDDFRYGARWLGLAAQKGQHQAQALLGQMLFNGDQLPRRPPAG
jgi:TPR repeat protein